MSADNSSTRWIRACLLYLVPVLLQHAYAAPPQTRWGTSSLGPDLKTVWAATPEAACTALNGVVTSGGKPNPRFTYKIGPPSGIQYECYAYYDGGRMTSNQWDKFTAPVMGCVDPRNGFYNFSSWRRNTNLPLDEQCPELPQATSNACPVGNPVAPLTGQKAQREPDDFQSSGSHSLNFRRSYRSELATYGVGWALAPGWRHNWERALNLAFRTDSYPTISALRDDGSTVRMIPNGQQWIDADGRTRDRLTNVIQGSEAWQYYVAATDQVESYDARGRLLRVIDRNGWLTSLTYTTGPTADAPGGNALLLESVRNQFGMMLRFAYDSKNRLTALTTPDGKQIRYDYDADGTATVTWPDQTLRRYHYGEDISGFKSALPGRLTGITDELGTRYSRYNYATTTGFVTSEEHAGGVDKLSFSYGTNATLVTDGNAFTRSFNYQLFGKLRQPTGASGSSPIGDPFNTIQYDTGNNVSRTVDRDGSDTRYSYDTQGRETQRIEGYGTAEAKATTTEWHPTWNLPLKVAAPSRVDYFTYDGQGQMTVHGWFPTADTNGSQGLNAAPSGPLSSNSYGYDASGLMTALSEVEDGAIAKQWSFTYDAQGNLLTATDGSRTARALAYDQAGRLLEAVNIDGDTLGYAYDSRGRVTQYEFGENVTAYVYDAIGQKTQVTGPQGDVTRYVYDAAHRLIDVLYNGESLTTPESTGTTVMAMTRAESGADNAGANPFASWFGWIAKLFKWLFPSAHAQAGPAPSPPFYGGGSSAPGTYTPNPLQDLVPGLSGEKTPGQWLAIATQRVIDYCRSKAKEQIHQGKIQAQGAGYRDPGVGDAEKWGPQLSPPTVEWGLSALERIEARMNRTQLRTRNQAIKDAKRYVVSTARAGGLDAVRKKSFYNDEIRNENADGGKRDERVDVDILSGKAFVP